MVGSVGVVVTGVEVSVGVVVEVSLPVLGVVDVLVGCDVSLELLVLWLAGAVEAGVVVLVGDDALATDGSLVGEDVRPITRRQPVV